nr:integrase, catalytic region, zinc finger, CCHC-type, peptidase aspartic, catalytic [Tanacetum cinerariifolium]
MFEPERPRTYADLDYHEQERYKADLCATLFLLKGLPKDIYMLVNHNTEAKVIWNDIKMLMYDNRLTKDVCTRPEVQDPDNHIDSADMGNSNIIPYEQYVKHNEGLVIPSGKSSIPNDAYVMHENSAYVPDDSFTTTLNIYKDQ